MVKDAEAHAEEDRKLKELIDARNQAENMIHAAEKSVVDLGEQVTEDEKKEIESRVADLREAIAGDDKEAIESKLQLLTESSGKLAERAYAQASAGDDSGGDADGGGDSGNSNSKSKSSSGDDVVDAEFEEVKDDK